MDKNRIRYVWKADIDNFKISLRIFFLFDENKAFPYFYQIYIQFNWVVKVFIVNNSINGHINMV